jgi:hypothetical protein
MTRLPLRRTAAPAAALLLALGLAGCATTGPAPSSSPEPTTSTATPADAPSAEPTPDAATIPATCDTILTPEADAKLEADGLEARGATLFDPIAIRISDEGGLTCSWGKPNTDNVVDVAQLGIGQEEPEWTAALTEAGYVQDDDPVPGGWRGEPDAANGISPVVVIDTGTLTYFSTPAYAEFLRPAS